MTPASDLPPAWQQRLEAVRRAEPGTKLLKRRKLADFVREKLRAEVTS